MPVGTGGERRHWAQRDGVWVPDAGEVDNLATPQNESLTLGVNEIGVTPAGGGPVLTGDAEDTGETTSQPVGPAGEIARYVDAVFSAPDSPLHEIQFGRDIFVTGYVPQSRVDALRTRIEVALAGGALVTSDGQSHDFDRPLIAIAAFWPPKDADRGRLQVDRMRQIYALFASENSQGVDLV